MWHIKTNNNTVIPDKRAPHIMRGDALIWNPGDMLLPRIYAGERDAFNEAALSADMLRWVPHHRATKTSRSCGMTINDLYPFTCFTGSDKRICNSRKRSSSTTFGACIIIS